MTGLHSTELEPEKWRVPGCGQGSQGLCSGKEGFSKPIDQRKNNIISVKSISKSMTNGELFDQNFLILLIRKK
jgi:hypothetical protein